MDVRAAACSARHLQVNGLLCAVDPAIERPQTPAGVQTVRRGLQAGCSPRNAAAGVQRCRDLAPQSKAEGGRPEQVEATLRELQMRPARLH